ncbi:F-box/kelch-repeat protein At3g23880-like [Trifolium pratense]|uniref:F-box/kelch-repeat protein At3g23880-like n=1 Tax=Trifolium pratense TaxID=57577 RepID=UPI001E696B11|nr:F-box/kelch-repeat protein At3g23880-like [Trifolium pratense]
MKRKNRHRGRKRTEEKKKKKKTRQYLPHELIIQILLRLPVKSLTRFKCVCKSWFSLISDPHFANSHFQLSAATPTRRILLLSNKAPRLKTRSIDFEESLKHVYASPNLKFFNHPLFPYNQFSITLTSSCRGFIFFKCSSSLCLCNPFNGIHKQIPFSTFDSKSKLDANIFCYMYGFGYDQSKDDYLVVSMSIDTSLDGVSSHLEFFSLRANTWKEIEGTHFPYITVSGAPKVGSLIDGAIHWLAFRRDLDSTVIVAFDLMERELVEMSFPDYIDIELIDCDLWVFGEFLALWVMDMEDNDKVDIWVMKEYKVRSSWTKTLVLSIDVNSTGFFYPICCTKSGDIIGTDGHTQLLKYDDKGQVIEHYSYNKRGGSQLAMYTESLLSLPGDSEQA